MAKPQFNQGVRLDFILNKALEDLLGTDARQLTEHH